MAASLGNHSIGPDDSGGEAAGGRFYGSYALDIERMFVV